VAPAAERVPRMCCPACLSLVSWRNLKFGQTFFCESCQKPLRAPKYYSLVLWGLTLLTVAFGAYLGGARGGLWLLWVVGAFFPALVVALWLALKGMPPNLEFDEKRLDEKRLFEFGGRREKD
jgi:hypothetical protein